MAGMLLQVIPRTNFTFSNLAPSEEQVFRVASRIDASQYVAGLLIVRVHSGSMSNANDTVSVICVDDPFTPEAPEVEFETPNLGTGAAVVEITNALNGDVPFYKTAPLGGTAGFFGPLLQVAVQCQRGAGTGVTVDLDISIDILLKTL